MSLLDHIVATEADAIKVLALVRAGVAVSSWQSSVVTSWANWKVTDLVNTVAALVPGQASAALQTSLAAAQVAMNEAGNLALGPQERYSAVKKAEIAVANLALATVAPTS